MRSISVVIVCKNEADIIGSTLKSLQGLTDDIVVYDSGSTDGTIDLVREFPVRLIEGPWEGFGKTKMKAIGSAKYDWILSLDADESIDEQLKESLDNWQPQGDMIVYEVAFKNFLGKKHLKFGEWGNDRHIRFFNRKKVSWDEAPVHEKLILPVYVQVKRLKGFVLHRTMKNLDDYRNKMHHYAMLGAEKYYSEGKKPGWIKRWLSPAFSFLKYYIFKAGFLDGKDGFISAKMTAWYTHLKYKRLKELNRQ